MPVVPHLPGAAVIGEKHKQGVFGKSVFFQCFHDLTYSRINAFQHGGQFRVTPACFSPACFSTSGFKLLLIFFDQVRRSIQPGMHTIIAEIKKKRLFLIPFDKITSLRTLTVSKIFMVFPGIKCADLIVGVEIITVSNVFGFRTDRSEEHTSELQSLMRISYAVFCVKKKKINTYIQK